MAEGGPRTVRVLLVDDAEEFAELAAEQLGQGPGGFDVAVETDPEAAIDRLREEAFDCVVSDFEMAGVDGLTFLERVREDDPDLPFILFTARGSETIASRAISAGVTEYMKKGTNPDQFDVLRNRIRNAVERYRTERELERTETRYRRLVEQNLTGIFIVRDGGFEYVNPKCAEIFGYEPAALSELSIYDVVAESDHERLARAIERCEAGETEELVYTLEGVGADGERFEFEVHSGRVDVDGEPAILGSLEDVTERRRYERELEEYRELVETVGDPMYVLDEDGYVRTVNAAMEALLGYDREELLGAHGSEFTTEEGWSTGREVLLDLADDGERHWETYEVEFVAVDGERVPVEVSAAVLTGEDGDLDGIVGVSRVIAERKERERELEEYETIVETAPDGVFILDEDGYFRSGNETGAELVGVDLEELVGSEYTVLVEQGVFEESVVETYLDCVRELLAGDGTDGQAKFEAELRPNTADARTCEVHIALLPHEGEFRGTVGVIRDITERKTIETALRAERDRLSALFENIPEPAVDYEYRDGVPHVLAVNDAFEETFGYGAAAVVGSALDEYIVPEAHEDEADDLNERVLAGEELNVEITRRTADGELRDFLLRNAPIPAGDGTVQGYAIYTDITDRKESQERVNALFEFSTDCIVDTEYVDGRPVVRRVNEAFEEVFGFEATDVVGEDIDEYIVPEDATAEAEMLNERVLDGEPVEREVTRLTATGSRNFLLRVLPIDVVDGDRTYAVYTDITKRTERERRLSSLHEATRGLMEATSGSEVADIALSAAESVLELNAAAFYAIEEQRDVLAPLAATDGAQELFDGMPEIGRDEDIAWQVFETGESVVTDDFRQSGVVYEPDTPVRSQLVIPVGEHGVFLAASTDVAAFTEADETLAKVLVSNVEAALDRAERESLLREREQALLRQNERLEEFAGVVSHDLRSPLTVAKGNAYLLRKKGEEEYLTKMERALDRMERLIDDLLSLARQGETVDEPERIEVAAVIEEAWHNVETADARLSMASDFAIHADEPRLQQLLENLFRNAVEHAGPDVTVRVGTFSDGFYVEDDGEGIPEEEREKLFEAGYTTDEMGTGFGLSIVKQIAEAHGWEVGVGEAVEGGARFEFTGVEVGHATGRDDPSPSARDEPDQSA